MAGGKRNGPDWAALVGTRDPAKAETDRKERRGASIEHEYEPLGHVERILA